MVNKIVRYILLLPLFAVAYSAAAQGVVVRVGLDNKNNEILIGEQVGYTLSVEYDAGKNIEIPEFKKTGEIAPGVEVVERIDRVTSTSGNRISVTDKYIVTAFDSALYVIPQMRIVVDSMEFLSDSLLLRVNTVPMDTTKYKAGEGSALPIAPMKSDIHETPIEWVDYKYSVYAGAASLILIILIVWVIVLLYKNKLIIRRRKIIPKEPAHIVANNKLGEMKENRELHLVERSKEFYTQLTDILREFITERMGVNAMEMTSSEIIEALLEIKDADSIKELKEMLVLSDLVKFSKYQPLQGDSGNAMRVVKEFVEANRASDEEIAALKEKEVVEYDKRSLSERITLIAIVSILGVAAVGLIVYTIMELYILFE